MLSRRSCFFLAYCIYLACRSKPYGAVHFVGYVAGFVPPYRYRCSRIVDELSQQCALFVSSQVNVSAQTIRNYPPVLVNKSIVCTLAHFLVARNSWYRGVVTVNEAEILWPCTTELPHPTFLLLSNWRVYAMSAMQITCPRTVRDWMKPL